MSLTFVDVNGLAGFMSYGFVREGFTMAGRTGTLDFGNRLAEANRHMLGENWRASFSNNPQDWPVYTEAELIAGCPPCSGWSCWSGPNNRGKDAKAHDHTWALIDYAGRVRPTAVVFESVQQAYTQGREHMQRYRDKLETLTGIRYDLHHVKMNNLLVGGCSYRPRYFFVAVKAGMPFGVESPRPEPGAGALPTIMDMIGDLEHAFHTWDHQPYRYPLSRFAEPLRSQSGTYDGHAGRNSIHTLRVAEIFEWLPNKNDDWKWGMDLASAVKMVYDTYGRLPPSWEDKQEKIVANDFYMGFTQPYRWRGDTWANVLTGGALDLVVHPTQPRFITHREAARIQGLPDDWAISPVRDYSPLQSTWGKAVSVNAGQWIAHWMKQSFAGRPGAHEAEAIGEREWLHDTDRGFSRQAARKRYYPDAGSGVTRIWMNNQQDAEAEETCEMDGDAA